MKWLAIILGTIAGLALIVLLVGALRSPDHIATVTFRLGKPRGEVWAVVSDFAKGPEWFPEVKSVERIADVDGRPAYREQYGGFTVTSVVREWVDSARIVREILPSGSFSGSWTLELADDPAGTRMAITERGHVGNPFFRGMMAFSDNTKTLKQYAQALATRLGTSLEVVDGGGGRQ